MNNNSTHACRECEKPLEFSEQVDAENTTSTIENEQPAATAQPAVRKKHRKNAKSKAAKNRDREGAKSEPTSNGVLETSSDARGAGNGHRMRPEMLSQQIGTAIRLEEILNGEVEVNHPICVDCSDTLIEDVDSKLEEVENELRDLKVYDAHLDMRDTQEEESLEELQAEFARIKAEEEMIEQRNEALKNERDMVFRERDLMLREQERLEESLNESTREYLLLKREWYVANEEFISLRNRNDYADHRLRTLNETNPVKELFCVEDNLPIGRISGQRLGKLTACPVEWTEINIAWGEVAFLLDFLARMFEFEFEEYVPIPCGDKSRMKPLRSTAEMLPLYLLGETDALQMTKYDCAQSAFLECVSQFERGIQLRYPHFKLPHPISPGRIQDPDSGISYRITLGLNTHETWTKALKYMLKNLKLILTFYLETVRRERRPARRQNE